MKVSIGGYSFYNSFLEGTMDIFGYLESMRFRYNLNTVDLWNGQFCARKDNLWQPPEEKLIKQIRAALDERELTLINIAVDSAHIWEDDAEQREWLHHNALEHIRAAGLLGAQSIRLDTGGRDLTAFTDEQLEHVVGRYREYAQLAEDNGMSIGPENHMGPSLYPKELKRLVEAVDRPNFGVLLHLNRWREDQEIGDELIAPYTYHVHFDARTASQTELAANRIDLLKSHGYDGYWGVEYNAEQNQYAEVGWLVAAAKRLVLASEQV